jgi:hypothetical protein
MNSSGYHEMKSSRKRTTYNSIEKFLLTIVWNPRGFHLIKVLEKGRKFNAGYYIVEILESLSHCLIVPLSQWHSIETTGNERKLLMDADNARPHIAKLSTQYFNENRMKSAPHSPYSILHIPLISPRRTFISSEMSRDVSQASHSRM